MEFGIDFIGHGNLLKYPKPSKVMMITVFQEENQGSVEDEAECRIRATTQKVPVVDQVGRRSEFNSCGEQHVHIQSESRNKRWQFGNGEKEEGGAE